MQETYITIGILSFTYILCMVSYINDSLTWLNNDHLVRDLVILLLVLVVIVLGVLTLSYSTLQTL